MKIGKTAMSQDYMFNFSHGLERSQQEQIRRDKMRVQGFDTLLDVEEEDAAGLPAVYETVGNLSEMFNLPTGSTGPELLENQMSYRRPSTIAGDWYLGQLGNSKDNLLGIGSPHNSHITSINADSAAQSMQLFLPRSPSSQSPSQDNRHNPIHMLLPNQSNSNSTVHQQGFHNTTSEVPFGTSSAQFTYNQGLSLSLSSSLQHLEEAKMEEFRLVDTSGEMPYFNQIPGVVLGQNHMVHFGYGSPSSSLGAVKNLRNSKYAKAAQELLEEFCSVSKGYLKKTKLGSKQNNTKPSASAGSGGGDRTSSSSKEIPPLSASERIEHQRRKVKLLSMLEEVDRRYSYYCEQMQMVASSFDLVMGFGAAVPYTALAQKAMSCHFRSLKDTISAQLKHSCEMLGEKDAGTSGVTKGETPRLKILEHSLRQQRAFHMGMMEQEAWRPQRGLPERSVNILRSWLFEHFLHPYPSDADKQLLSRQTGLSRNQVSNWFINARVRLWKPMVEEMYQKESKDGEEEEETDHDRDHDDHEEDGQCNDQNQTEMNTSGPSTSFAQPPSHDTALLPTPINAAKLSNITINELESDPSIFSFNKPYGLSDNRALAAAAATAFSAAGDVSLTLGLRQSERSNFHN